MAEQLKRHGKEAQKHTYTLLLVPRTSTLVSRILEEEGVLGDITISSYNLQFIPLAEDVISLENDNAFKELWVVRRCPLRSLSAILTSLAGWRRDGYLQLHASPAQSTTCLRPVPSNRRQGRLRYSTSVPPRVTTSLIGA